MQTTLLRGHLQVALVSVFLIASIGVPASAVTQVQTADPGGNLLCYNCGNTNRTQKSGTAVSGWVDPNTDGTANTGMGYVVPNDGTEYSGQMSVVVTADDGSLVGNYTNDVADFGDGSILYEGLDGIYIPIGGSVSISITESNATGRSFSAGWALRNYRP